MNLQKETKHLKVLYVEDSMMMRKVTYKLLSNYFNTIDLAKDGNEAIKLYENFFNKNGFFYDIVITDLEMPVLDGIELSKLILKINLFQEIIVLSAIQDFNKLVKLINIGIKKFISKPIQKEQLEDVISDVCQNLKIKQVQKEESLKVKNLNKILEKSLKEKTDISPILNVDGNIEEFIAVSHDMTQLVSSLEEANNSKEAKENFFINISHEMKTPLNSILGFSSLLKKRLKNDEKSLQMINTIFDTAKDLNRLIESILDMQKIQENSLKIIDVAFNPHEEINKCINRYVKFSYDKKQKYEVFIDSEIPTSLFGDPIRIIQILGIFIDNAIKFTHEKGTVQISIIYNNIKEILICEIKDNGIGIAKENQKKIFNMQQLDSKMNRLYEGAGISLNIAKSLMNMMKGNITLKSIPSKGSFFKLEFPLRKITANNG